MPDEEAPDAPRSNPLRHVEAAQQVTEETARRLIGALERQRADHATFAAARSSALSSPRWVSRWCSRASRSSCRTRAYLDNGWGAVLLGLGLLFVSGLLLQKLIKGE